MRAGKIIRSQLGLTQSEMAELLSVSRSLFALYENGKRDLTTPGLVKLAEISSFIASADSKKKLVHPLLKAQNVKASLALEKYAKEQAYQKLLAERKLAATQKAFNQKMLLLALINYFNDNTNAKAEVNQTADLLRILEKKAVKTIEQNGLDKQAVLEKQIAKYRAASET